MKVYHHAESIIILPQHQTMTIVKKVSFVKAFVWFFMSERAEALLQYADRLEK